jgi:hypothetical protein
MGDQTAGGVLLLFAAVVLTLLFVTGRLAWLVDAVADFDVIRGKAAPKPKPKPAIEKPAAPSPVRVA